VPGIWRYEMLNGLGKGVTRQRACRKQRANPSGMRRSEVRRTPTYD